MRKRILFLILPLFLFQLTSAALDLELTHGVDSAIPIAVVPFADRTNPLATMVSNIISADLKNSGQFNVLPSYQINTYPSTPADVHREDWNNLNSLVMGSVKPISNDRYQINFSLVDLYKKAGPDSVLLSQSIEVTQSSLRRGAHQIADMIFKKLTGIPGCFNTKIAYVLVKRRPMQPSRYFLMVADADGYRPQVLVSSSDPMMSPAWSPDGRHIAYVSFENRRAAIYILDVFSGSRHLVSQQTGINGAPAFTKDGKQLALVLSQGDNTKIALLDLASLQQTPLTDGRSIDTEPSFSLDGKTMLFTSDRSGTPEIYSFDLSTKAIQKLSNTGDYNARGQLTADMNHLVMLDRSHGQFNIAVQDLQNGDVDLLTDDGNAQSPSVSPNGMMVIYSTRQNKQGLLGLVSIDGRAKLILPDNEGSVQDPAWGP